MDTSAILSVPRFQPRSCKPGKQPLTARWVQSYNDMKYVANFQASLTNISSSSKVRSEFFLPMRFCVGEQPDWVAKAAPYLFVPREGARDTLARLVVQCFRRRQTPCMPNFQQEVVQQDVELFAICNDWRRKSYCTAQRLKHHHCYDCQFPSDKTKSAGCQLINKVSAISLS